MVPLANVSGLAALRPLLTTTPPVLVSNPSWMWFRISEVFAGNPCALNVQLAVPPVMLLLASRVTFRVTVALPVALESALVTGGTSFAAVNCAVKMRVFGFADGAGVLLSLPQAAIVTAH